MEVNHISSLPLQRSRDTYQELGGEGQSPGCHDIQYECLSDFLSFLRRSVFWDGDLCPRILLRVVKREIHLVLCDSWLGLEPLDPCCGPLDYVSSSKVPSYVQVLRESPHSDDLVYPQIGLHMYSMLGSISYKSALFFVLACAFKFKLKGAWENSESWICLKVLEDRQIWSGLRQLDLAHNIVRFLKHDDPGQVLAVYPYRLALTLRTLQERSLLFTDKRVHNMFLKMDCTYLPEYYNSDESLGSGKRPFALPCNLVDCFLCMGSGVLSEDVPVFSGTCWRSEKFSRVDSRIAI